MSFFHFGYGEYHQLLNGQDVRGLGPMCTLLQCLVRHSDPRPGKPPEAPSRSLGDRLGLVTQADCSDKA